MKRSYVIALTAGIAILFGSVQSSQAVEQRGNVNIVVYSFLYEPQVGVIGSFQSRSPGYVSVTVPFGTLEARRKVIVSAGGAVTGGLPYGSYQLSIFPTTQRDTSCNQAFTLREPTKTITMYVARTEGDPTSSDPADKPYTYCKILGPYDKLPKL